MDATYKYTLTCKNCGEVSGFRKLNNTLRSIKNGGHPCYCSKCKCDEFEFKQLRQAKIAYLNHLYMPIQKKFKNEGI